MPTAVAHADTAAPQQATTPGQAIPAIQKNDYSLEFFQGPVLAPSRVTSLAGAYTAYSEGTEGVATNAAAPAVREPFSLKWWDVDISPSISLPGGYASGTDFDNRGSGGDAALRERTNHFLYLSLGAKVQVGAFGVAVLGELLRYEVKDPKPQQQQQGIALAYGRYHADVAYGFLDGQLAIGGGVRVVTLALSNSSPAASLLTTPVNALTDKISVTMTGVAPEVGVVVKPNGAIYRVGATFRAPVEGGFFGFGSAPQSTFDGVVHASSSDSPVLPRSVVQPWEVETGFAIQLGPRPLNPTWINPHEEEAETTNRINELRKSRAAGIANAETPDERARLVLLDKTERAAEDQDLAQESDRLLEVRKARYANWPREKLLIVGSLLLTGPSSNAVALEGFIDQKREIVGRNVSITPRAGVEAEPLENRMRARLGGYVEPSRFSDGNPRQHFTFGGDVRVLNFDVLNLFPNPWQISFIVDLAPRYQNYGIGIGAWH